MAELLPTLIDYDVRTKLEELKEPREAERLAYEYKITQEEMYFIADEIGQYFHYQDLLDSPCFTDFERDPELYELIQLELGTRTKPSSVEEWRENTDDAIKDRIKQKYLQDSIDKGEDQVLTDKKFEDHFIRARIETRANRDGQVSLQDLIYFWKNDQDSFVDSIYEAVADKEEKALKLLSGIADEKKRAELQAKVEATVFGKVTNLEYLLNFHLDQDITKVENFSEEDMLKIDSFAQSLMPSLRRIIPTIRGMKRSIKAANDAKSPDVARKAEEIANLHKAPIEKVQTSNQRIEKFMKRRTGKEYQLGVEQVYDENVDMVDRDFLTAYVNYSQELRSLWALLNEGKVVETNYVRSIMEKAETILKKNPPTVVYFHGDFGTGKTAIAIHLAKTELAPGRDPIVVSGNKFIDPDRFTEEFKVAKMKPNQFLSSMYSLLGEDKIVDDSEPIDQILAELVGTKQEMRVKMMDQYIQEYGGEDKIPKELLADLNDSLDNLYTNQVQGRYILGAMFEAMRTGVPLIIDEANAISPEVMIAFNDLLTKRIGEKMKTRADLREFTIQKGYCIIWTGNTGERYQQARFGNKGDVDPASYSRIVPIEVRYLPNERDINSIQGSIEKLELEKISNQTFNDAEEMEKYVKDSRREAANNQIFQVLMMKLLNRRLGSELLVRTDDRYSLFKDIYRLAIGTRIIMDVFEGNDWKDGTGNSIFPNLNVQGILGSSDNFTAYKEVLVKANLSMRELMDNIVGGYLDSGCNMDIEYYLWQYIEKYSNFPEEQAIIYSILQKAQFFNTTEGWPNISNLAGSDVKNEMKKVMAIDPLAAVDKYKRIRKNGEFTTLLQTNGKYAYEYFSSLETLQLVFGYLPARKVGEYQEVSQKIIEARAKEQEGSGVEAVYANQLLDDISQTVTLICDPAKYANSEESQQVMGEIFAHPLIVDVRESGKEAFRDISESQLFEQLSDFYDLLLDISVRAGKMTEEAAAEAKAMNLAGKMAAVKNAWSGSGASE